MIPLYKNIKHAKQNHFHLVVKLLNIMILLLRSGDGKFLHGEIVHRDSFPRKRKLLYF